jgi:hypothetical protein
VSLMPEQLGFQGVLNSSVGYSTVQQLYCQSSLFLRNLPISWPMFFARLELFFRRFWALYFSQRVKEWATN